MSKEKILAMMLAILLIISALPASALASVSVLTNPYVGSAFSVLASDLSDIKAPIVFSYDNEFADWFGRVFTEGIPSSDLSPITSGNKLQLVFGGEGLNVQRFTQPQESAITEFFKTSHYSSVEIYLTNLAPSYEGAVIYAYPTGGTALIKSKDWPDSMDSWHHGQKNHQYAYMTDSRLDSDPAYERVSYLIGLIGASTRVNIYMSNELSEYETPSTTINIYRLIARDGSVKELNSLDDVNPDGTYEEGGKIYYLHDENGDLIDKDGNYYTITGLKKGYYTSFAKSSRAMPQAKEGSENTPKYELERYKNTQKAEPLDTNIFDGFYLFEYYSITSKLWGNFETADGEDFFTYNRIPPPTVNNNDYFYFDEQIKDSILQVAQTGKDITIDLSNYPFKGFLVQKGGQNGIGEDRLIYLECSIIGTIELSASPNNPPEIEITGFDFGGPNNGAWYLSYAYEDGHINITDPDFEYKYDNSDQKTVKPHPSEPKYDLVPDTRIVPGKYMYRHATVYNITNSYFNDMALVGITIGDGTTLSISASCRISDVTVKSGGYLNLTKIDYAVLNSLNSKWVENLILEPKSHIDFPIGTTEATAAAWLSASRASADFYISVAGKPINPKPANITVIPRYGVYKPASGMGKYYCFQGATAYFEVRLSSLESWQGYRGMYAYITGNTSSATKFASRELPWVALGASDPSSPTFSWKNQDAFARSNGDGTYSYFAPLYIGADESGQNIKVALDSVLTDAFWGQEHEGVFEFEAKPLPTLTKATISPEAASVAKGATQAFYANIYTQGGDYLSNSQKTEWSITGSESKATKIDQNGILTVASDETAKTIVVNAAVSIYDIYSDLFSITLDGVEFASSSNMLTASSVVNVAGNGSDNSSAGALSKPTLSISYLSPASVRASWSPVSGAISYSLSFASSASGAYTPVDKATNISVLTADANGLKTGAYYWFRVEAKNSAQSSMSDSLAVRARPLRPASLSAKRGGLSGTASVSWGLVAEADGYAIYVSSSRNGPYTLKGIANDRLTQSAIISGLKSGATYYFKVASFAKAGSLKVPSVYTGAVSALAK